ncbi:hypothetical protein A3218_22695 [Pseudomonas chlororaphis]|uniref:lysozyme inhibitor LprI family protein n=1 Tax=Pseudomonas chlororaphis TaxID=587753 RepID=UPI000789FDBA|nr:lysozyme inhibitor LprI family protein [Pseudomonas chlororaphis]AMS16973.1 hypothetical protein A3218_22695 [Pseudomonas chlororaphis]
MRVFFDCSRKFILLSLLAILSSSAIGGECDNITLSAQVDLCAKEKKDSADAKLNESYKDLISRVRVQYEANSELGGLYLEKLKGTQRAWLKYRDANCDLEAFEVEVGLPAQITIVNNCVARMSEERTAYLNGVMN